MKTYESLKNGIDATMKEIENQILEIHKLVNSMNNHHEEPINIKGEIVIGDEQNEPSHFAEHRIAEDENSEEE